MSRDDARDHRFRQMHQGTQAHPCVAPIPIFAIGLPSMLEKDSTPLPVEFAARCRKCEQCLAHRRRLWTARAIDEVSASERTWFGTLTVAPAHRFRLAVLAERKHLRRGGESLSSLEPPERFKLLAASLGEEVTKFFKRLRKKHGGLRYLLVTERHKSGDPHLHLLLHEAKQPVTKATLEEQWRLGFSHWRLVDRDPGAATYVCKYLAKDALTRVRASQHYGQPTLVRRLTERLTESALVISARSDQN